MLIRQHLRSRFEQTGSSAGLYLESRSVHPHLPVTGVRAPLAAFLRLRCRTLSPEERLKLLRIWETKHHEQRALPAFRALLELPFEHVLVSHGEPVHTRADFEAALAREPWRG